MSEQKLTDVTGKALFALESGVYKYTASKSGLKTETGNFEVTDSAKSISVILQQSYEVTFTVQDSITTDPVSGFSVIISVSGIVLHTKTTGANGIAEFELLPGVYDYEAINSDYDTVAGTVTVVNAPVGVAISAVTIPLLSALSGSIDPNDVVDLSVVEPYPTTVSISGSSVAGDPILWRGWEFRALDSAISLRRLSAYTRYTMNYAFVITGAEEVNSRSAPLYRSVTLPGVAGQWSSIGLSRPLDIPRYTAYRLWLRVNLIDATNFPEESVVTPGKITTNSPIQYVRSMMVYVPRQTGGYTESALARPQRPAIATTDFAPMIDFEYSEV